MPALLRPAGLLEDERALHLVALSVLLNKKYGHEYLTWPPEALREQLEEDFGGIGPLAWERIQAVRVLHVHDAFWKEWEIFEKITAAAIGVFPIFSHAQPPEAEDIAVVLTVAATFDSHEYDDDVKAYIASACLTDGTWYLEPPLDIAQDALAKHDERKGIERDTKSVAMRLQTASKYINLPETATDVQVNNVLSVRKAVAEYKEQLEAQLREIA
jgi:hypothetical protein